MKITSSAGKNLEERLNNLEKLIRILKKNKIAVSVGIFPENATRNDGHTNPEIGAIHELGLGDHPRRSFLQMPLQTQFKKQLDADEDTLKACLKEGNLGELADSIAAAALRCVRESFSTNGYGFWPPSKKAEGDTLVETGQLRDSVTTQTKKG